MSPADDWAAEPEHSDEVIHRATGATWDEWVARIDAGAGRDAAHPAIAAWVNGHSDIGGWWSQAVTVGYERITGKRLPGQMPDGTFTVSRSRTLPLAPDRLRDLLDEDPGAVAALPGATATRTSRAGVKSPRFALADAAGAGIGTLQLGFDAVKKGARLTVSHEKIDSFETAEEWKGRWADWLEQVEAALPGE